MRLTDDHVLCGQVKVGEDTRQGGGKAKRQNDANTCSKRGGSDRSEERAVNTRVELQQKQAQIRVARSNNTQLKRKLSTVESKVRRDYSKYKKQCDNRESDRVSNGSKRKQGDIEGDNPPDDGYHDNHHPMGQHTELDTQTREVGTAKGTDTKRSSQVSNITACTIAYRI